MELKLLDGSIKEMPEGAIAFELAEAISPDFARTVCACEINGKIEDLRYKLKDGDEVNFLKFDSKAGKYAFHHTSAHILAQAITRLYPDVQLAIGPPIENGFYYDIEMEKQLGTEDLQEIEKEMQKIVKEGLAIESFILPRREALDFVDQQKQSYKRELIEDLAEDEVISFYKMGEFTDLCAGPHLISTRPVKAIKLLQIAGAYWRGSEKNKMLQRVYGCSFPDKKSLNAYLKAREEALARDHNKLGRQLDYFTTVDEIGQGLPIMLPKGAKVLQLLKRYVEDEEAKAGYEITLTPLLAKNDLYRISGHWDHYREGMFILGDEEADDAMALRPMTCPFQFQAYLTKTRSYRDLPIRYAETSTLFRNEASGEMHGLIRLRQFTISEGHLIVRPDQVKAEFLGALDLANKMLKSIGLEEDVSYRYSIWDEDNREKYIGSKEAWEDAQASMKAILDSSDLEYETGIGEAAFYGPKLDIQIKNVFGKEDTLITIQIDFQLAERFKMYYTDQDGERKHPYIIHRTSIGCYERTLALLLEKYNAALPLWLAPEQIRLLPISEKHVEASKDLAQRLRKAGFRLELDSRSEKIGKKIKEAQLEKVPYMLILGDREIENQEYALRSRLEGNLGSFSFTKICQMLQSEIEQKLTKSPYLAQ